MKEFRKELLELLYANSGDYVDINPIMEKYCGTETSFDTGDYSLVKCRNKISADLIELKSKMGWINLTRDGYNTGHHLNHTTGKREFLFNDIIKAQMTMKGELEYGKMKKEETTVSPITNIQHIGTNSGVAIQSSVLDEAAFLPSTNPTTVQNIEAPRTGTKTSLGKFIMNNIVVIVVTVIAGLIVGFLLYKFGWL